jgi:hypothetical protein
MAASEPKKGSRAEKAFCPRLRCAIETIAGGGSGVMAKVLGQLTENPPARQEGDPRGREHHSACQWSPPSIRQSKGQNNGFSMMIDALPQPPRSPADALDPSPVAAE